MLTSLAYIFLLGLFFATLCQKLKLPRIIGMIATGIPQLIMAGASCDDVFVIVLFFTFVTMVQGGHASLSDFIGIPVSIVLGILLGICGGHLLPKLSGQRPLNCWRDVTDKSNSSMAISEVTVLHLVYSSKR